MTAVSNCRSLAFLDPLFARAALVVERDDPLGGAAHVGDDESDARNKLARVPLDLGDHPARLGPASRLIAEVGVVPPNIVRRATDWALEQVADPVLEDLIGWNTDGILDPLGFEILVDPRHGESRIRTEVDAQDLALVAHNYRLEHIAPALGAVHVAGTQRAALQIAELVEHEQRMIAGAGVMAVPGAVLLLAVRWAHARIHIEHDALRWTTTMDDIDPLAGQVGKSRE